MVQFKCHVTHLKVTITQSDEVTTPSYFATNPVTNVTSTSATLNATVYDAGVPEYTRRGFCYATSANPTTENNQVEVDGTGTGDFDADITELTPNATYYIRVDLSN